jgi:D-alanyl-D-alanine carboxypeptidase
LSFQQFRSPLTAITAVLLLASLAGCASAGSGHPVAGSIAPGSISPGSIAPGSIAPGSIAPGSIAPGSNSDELGPEDGYLPPGESVQLTDDVPSVTKLDSRLRDALVQANAVSEADLGVEITLVDGWRSKRYQEYLFQQAVVEYGSEGEASRWVKRGDQSKHQLGQAVDIATADAMDFLNRFGNEYGLCQIYANEAWHFELAADPSGACPPQLSDGSAG